MRRAIYIALSVLGIPLVLVAGTFGVLQTGYARDQVRLRIADMTAGTSTQVQIDAIGGLVPFDMQLTGLRISDRDGIWLTADRVTVDWSPLALLGGRLQVDEVAAGAIDLTRLPAPAETQAPEPPGPLIPQHPVAIDLRLLSVEHLALAAPILGEPAALSLSASAKLGEIGDGLSASLTLQQLSGNTGTAAIDLAYRPDQEFLSLKGRVEEPRGGILGRLLGLPQASNLSVALDGQGPLEAWQGNLKARLNGELLLDLTAESRGREERTISFALQANPGGILPQQFRSLVADGVEAKGAFKIAADRRTIGVSEFTAKSAAGTIGVSGILGLSAPGDLAVTVDVSDSQPFAALMPDVMWSGAAVQARLQGEIGMPQVTADVMLQDLALDDLRAVTSKLALDASAAQGFEQPIGIRADLQMSDLTSSDAQLTRLLTDGIRLSFAGSADRTGTIVADTADFSAGVLRLTGSGRAEKWGAAARRSDATLTIADIGAVGAPLGLPGKGAAEISMKLEPAVTGDRLEMNGTGQALSLSEPILDRLLGPSPHLHLALEGKVPQAMTITSAQLIGAKARLDAQGTVATRDLDLSFTASLDDAAAIDPMMRGQAMMDGTIYGTMDAPAVVVEINAPALSLADHRAENVKLSATALDLLSRPKIELEGAARVDQLLASIATSVTVDGERMAAQDLVVTLGKSRLTGDIARAQALLSGKLLLDAPDLAEIGRVARIAMGGNLSSTLGLDSANGKQGVTLSATGHGISATDSLKLRSLNLQATASDLFGAPVVAADLELDEPVIADQTLSKIFLTTNGPLSALQAKLSMAGSDLNASAEAEIAQIEAGYRIGLQAFAAEVKDIHIRIEQPATIEIGAATTRIEHVALAIEDGRLHLDGTVASDELRMATTMESLPVSLVRAFSPGLPLRGRLDGDLEVSGAPASPSGHFTIAGRDIGVTDEPQQQVDLDVTGKLQQGRLDIEVGVKPKAGGDLAITAMLSSLQSDARLEAKAIGTLDLSLVDAFLAGGADRIAGKADLDLAIAGALSAPEMSGRATLKDGSYENLRYGIKLRQIAANGRANGPVIQIASLTATTPGGGQVSGEGEINLRNDMETDIRLKARSATIIDTDLATATVNSDLAIIGNLKSRLKLSGKVKVLKADIRVPDRLPANVQEIEVVEVNAPPHIAARLAAQKPPPSQGAILDLDLAIDAPHQVAVRGRGLDAALGGAIHLGGTAAKPDIDGAFKLRRGSLEIAGKRLDFTKGQLTFEGGERIDPILDLTATTRAGDLKVTAHVEGSARAPRIMLSSVPTMPEDEILAHLLFGKSAGALSPFELLQLAQATADLAGLSAGPGVLDRIRKSTGLDRLSLEQSKGAAGPSLSAGRYVAEGVYVGVSQGSDSASSTATVEIEVTPNVKVETEIGAGSGGKTGVNLEWDY